MITEYYPPAGFHFSVFFGKNPIDNQFQSVSGLSVELKTEEYAEGGENRFKYKLPLGTEFPNLVLKRGIVIDSHLVRWFKNAFDDFKFEPRDIIITLLNHLHVPIYTWKVVGCIPVKWTVDELNSMEGKVLVETIELSYQYFTSNHEVYAG